LINRPLTAEVSIAIVPGFTLGKGVTIDYFETLLRIIATDSDNIQSVIPMIFGY